LKRISVGLSGHLQFLSFKKHLVTKIRLISLPPVWIKGSSLNVDDYRMNVEKNGSKNWLVNMVIVFLPPLKKFGVSSLQNKLKFIPKAGKKSSNNFGRKHTSLYLCTPILKNGWQ
jgi:hypothetical protein